jgi:hypothetical protein
MTERAESTNDFPPIDEQLDLLLRGVADLVTEDQSRRASILRHPTFTSAIPSCSTK